MFYFLLSGTLLSWLYFGQVHGSFTNNPECGTEGVGDNPTLVKINECFGTILDQQWVVTSVRCLGATKNFKIQVLGSSEMIEASFTCQMSAMPLILIKTKNPIDNAKPYCFPGGDYGQDIEDMESFELEFLRHNSVEKFSLDNPPTLVDQSLVFEDSEHPESYTGHSGVLIGIKQNKFIQLGIVVNKECGHHMCKYYAISFLHNGQNVSDSIQKKAICKNSMVCKNGKCSKVTQRSGLKKNGTSEPEVEDKKKTGANKNSRFPEDDETNKSIKKSKDRGTWKIMWIMILLGVTFVILTICIIVRVVIAKKIAKDQELFENWKRGIN